MYITAPQIHNGKDWLVTGSTLELADDGTITAILSAPTSDTVYYKGVLVPGFVNTHCHLELSHMRGVIPQHTGLVPFLKNVIKRRNEHTDAQKKEARDSAFTEMLNNGIVAVGDIANTTDTLEIRAKEQLHIHTFIESLGFSEVNARKSFGFAEKTYESFAAQPAASKILRQTITPHAPYSVSAALFRLIDKHIPGSLLSIHNQESIDEHQYYRTKQGAIRDLLSALNIDDSFFTPTGKSSLQSYLQYLSAERTYVFVHNTCTEKEDVQYALSRIKEAYWCLCPNANLYIENSLPDIDMLLAEKATICIGTDSLASNTELSVLSELYTIKQEYPIIPWGTLLSWGIYNGAKALQMQDTVGLFAPGMKPGVVQLTGLDSVGKPKAKRLF